MEILNEFNHIMKPSQKRWLDAFIAWRGESNILHIALTRGGYILVDYRRTFIKTGFPYGREIRGTRGGFISTFLAKDYDHEHNWLLDGIERDKLTGSKHFGVA